MGCHLIESKKNIYIYIYNNICTSYYRYIPLRLVRRVSPNSRSCASSNSSSHNFNLRSLFSPYILDSFDSYSGCLKHYYFARFAFQGALEAALCHSLKIGSETIQVYSIKKDESGRFVFPVEGAWRSKKQCKNSAMKRAHWF
jgi:hypothetical protein